MLRDSVWLTMWLLASSDGRIPGRNLEDQLHWKALYFEYKICIVLYIFKPLLLVQFPDSKEIFYVQHLFSPLAPLSSQ